MNAAAAVQPEFRGMRYDNVRSAMAEEGLIRLLLHDDTLFGDTCPLREEDFSAPLLSRIFAGLWEHRGSSHSLSALSAVLSPEEMSHLTSVLQKPESTANVQKALTDYIQIIRDEAQKRVGSEIDPLHAATNKYKKRKSTEDIDHE